MEQSTEINEALEQFIKRKNKVHVHNASMHAGANVNFYCGICGDICYALPEGYDPEDVTERICIHCQKLRSEGNLRTVLRLYENSAME